MAIVQNPVTGRTRKKFGTAVFTKQFGKNVMKTKPIEVSNPKTAGQVSQRHKFTTAVYVIRQALKVINDAYAGSLRNMSPFNKIVSYNLKNSFVWDSLEHTKLVLCTHDGSMVNNVTLTGQPNQVMEVTWHPNTIRPDELASLLTFVIFNCTTNQAEIFPDVAPRSAGTASVTVPESWVGALTALHIVTTDFTQFIKKQPKKIVKFRAGAELASQVK